MIHIENFVSAVRSAFNTEDFIPLHVPRFNKNESYYVQETIKSTFVSSVGKFVNDVENQTKEITGSKHAIATVNGTAALHIALRLVGVKQNTEVITQSLTFVATVNAIAYNGADPIFIDVDEDTMGMSPISLDNFLKKNCEIIGGVCINRVTGKKISACLPMHTFGFLCRINEIRTICNNWKIPLIEDAAEAVGSISSNGKSAGAIGDIGTYSFNGNKIITAGGGGMIITNDEKIGIQAKHITTTAKRNHQWEYFHDEIGFNYRMPNINAALLKAQFESLNTFILSKSKLYNHYKDVLNLNKIGEIVEIPETTSQWNYWLISLKLKSRKERDIFLKETNSKGVMTRPIWTLSWKLPMYSQCLRDDQKVSIDLENRIINIPSSAK